MILVQVRKPQLHRHVCPTSSRSVSFRFECLDNTRTVAGCLRRWVSSLVDHWSTDGYVGYDAHTVHISAKIRKGKEVHPVIDARLELSCSDLVLFTRDLARLERHVYREWLRLRSNAAWELIPFDWCPLTSDFSNMNGPVA